MVSESPAVARRRLRLTLRSLRDDRSLTQAAVAEALDWSLSKLIRIERGEVTISRTDVRALLDHYGVIDESTVRPLLDLARASRQRDWWDEPQFRGQVTRATGQLLDFETAATVIRSFQPSVFPGLLQTAEYAAAIIGYFDEEVSQETRAARLELRTRRFSHVFEQANPPEYHLVIDESVIWRQVGGPQVLADQLDWLLTQIEGERVRVRILLTEDPVPVMLGSFILIDLDVNGDSVAGRPNDAVVYREAQASDEIVHDPVEIARHVHIFDRLWRSALDDKPSARLISARRAALLTDIDRSQRRVHHQRSGPV
jgi:transcriptional regulator with XRE-family HTH domain